MKTLWLREGPLGWAGGVFCAFEAIESGTRHFSERSRAASG